MLGAVSAANHHGPHELTDALQLNTGSPAVFLSVSRTDCARVCFLTDQFIDRPIMRTHARVDSRSLAERLCMFGGRRELFRCWSRCATFYLLSNVKLQQKLTISRSPPPAVHVHPSVAWSGLFVWIPNIHFQANSACVHELFTTPA